MHTIGTDQIIISSMKLFICLVLFLMNMNNYVFNYITTTSMIFSCLFLGYFNILSKGKDYKHHFILGRNGLAVYKLVSHGACPALPHPALPCPAPPCPALQSNTLFLFRVGRSKTWRQTWTLQWRPWTWRIALFPPRSHPARLCTTH